MKIEPLYVVDTNALIWYLMDDKKLGKQAANIFTAAEHGETRLVISAIVMAEIYYAHKKFSLFPDFSVVFRRLQAAPYVRFIPFEGGSALT